MCGHEWQVGNPLADGDTVSIVKDLKVKGIRLAADPVDGHDIDATVPGFGRMRLKCSVVKKINCAGPPRGEFS